MRQTPFVRSIAQFITVVSGGASLSHIVGSLHTNHTNPNRDKDAGSKIWVVLGNFLEDLPLSKNF